VIPRNVRVSEAPGYGQSVLTYDPGSRGSTSYVEAARELAQRGAALPPVERTSSPGALPVPPVAALILGEPAAPTADPSRTQESP
jgi:chromosome partitioning protein